MSKTASFYYCDCSADFHFCIYISLSGDLPNRQALKNEDSAALAAYVDFPSVRQGIKDQLNTELVKKFPEHAQASEGGFAAFGAFYWRLRWWIKWWM